MNHRLSPFACNGWVSVWVGTFDSIEAAEEYFGIPDEIGVYLPPEQFVADFGLGEFEPEKLAANFERLTPRPIEELLASVPGARGFSEQVIQAANERGLGEQQGIALLYDYAYQPSGPTIDSPSRLCFVGAFRYRPGLRPERSDGVPGVPPSTQRGDGLLIWTGRAIAAIVILAVIGSCLGFFPPLRVGLTLAGGLLVGALGLGFERPRLAATALGCSVLLSLFLLRDVVEVRAATPADRIRERYFGFEIDETGSKGTIRNVAVATGTFTLRTWLTVRLYLVANAEVADFSTMTVGRSPNQIGAPYWIDMKITIALRDRMTPEGRLTELGCAGMSRGGGGTSQFRHEVTGQEKHILPTTLYRGSRHIVYIEGDAVTKLDPTMSIEDFATANPGKFLVVVVEMPP